MTMEHIFPKAVLQSSICTMRRGRAHLTKMEMAYGMSMYETLKISGKKSFQQTKYMSWNGSTTQVRAILRSPELSPQFFLFSFVTYKWADGADHCFDLPRDGTAIKPTSGQYYRKDPSLFSKVDNLISKGLSTDQVHNSIARAGASTVSEAIPGLKLIHNRKLLSKKETSTSSSSKKQFKSEAEEMISCLQSVPFLQSATFTKESYVAFNSLSNMINDLYRFCINGNSVLRVDTTFELVEGLWLTDTIQYNTTQYNILYLTKVT